VSDTLIDARTQIVFDHFDEKLMRLSNRLEKGKASKYFFLKIMLYSYYFPIYFLKKFYIII